MVFGFYVWIAAQLSLLAMTAKTRSLQEKYSCHQADDGKACHVLNTHGLPRSYRCSQ